MRKKESAHGRVLVTLVLTGLLLAGTILSACVPAAPPAAEPAAPTEAAPEPAEEAEAPAPEPQEEEVVLRIMDNWGADPTHSKYTPLHSAFEDFMALYPNIKIEEEVFGDHEIPTKVVTMYLAGEEPDLVLQNLHQAALDWLGCFSIGR